LAAQLTKPTLAVKASFMVQLQRVALRLVLRRQWKQAFTIRN
jgi:hypothetical protein